MTNFSGDSIGDLFIEIKARQDQFDRELRRIRKTSEDTAKQIEGRFAKLKNLGNNFKGFLVGAGILTGIQKLTSFVGDATQAAFTQAKAERAVEQAIESTGGAAGLSASELKTYASELQKLTGIGDEVQLKDVTTQLLTFTKVAGDNFKRAQAITLDLSETLGTNLRSSAIQVGKALNDPIRGLDGLGRAGIQFNDEQKKLIKTLVESGDLYKAQSLILDELETQYGGQAAAAAEAEAGTRQFWAAVGDLSEVVGAKFIKIISPMVETLNEWLGATEDVSTKTEAATRETSRQIGEFDKLSFAYERLAQNASRSAAEQKLYEKTIKDLQRLYPNYLKSVDLEKDGYKEISVALKEARKDLQAFLEQKVKLAVVQDLETEFIDLGKQLDQLAQSRINIEKEINDALTGNSGLEDVKAAQLVDVSLQPQLDFVDTLEKQIIERQEQLKKRIADTQAAIGDFLPPATPTTTPASGAQSQPVERETASPSATVNAERDAGRAIFERSVAEYRAFYDTLRFEAAGYLEYRKQLIAQEAAEIRKFASGADAEQFEQKKLEDLKREEKQFFESRRFEAIGYKEFRIRQIEEQVEVFSRTASDITEVEERRTELMQQFAREEAEYFKSQQDTKLSYFASAMDEIERRQSDNINLIVEGYEVFTDSFSNALSDMVFEQQKFGDAVKQIWQDLSRAVVAEIGRMIAKMIAFNALKAVGNAILPGLGGSAIGGITDGLTAQHGGTFTGTSQGVKKMQHGGSFIVPGGYPNDSYPLMVQTGERVSVTRAGMVNMEHVELGKIKDAIQAMNRNMLIQSDRMQKIEGEILLESTISGRDLELSSQRQQRFNTRMK